MPPNLWFGDAEPKGNIETHFPPAKDLLDREWLYRQKLDGCEWGIKENKFICVPPAQHNLAIMVVVPKMGYWLLG